jgi:hypothetical protein
MVASDRWGKMMQRLSEMPEHERRKEICYQKTMCICSRCPSYIGTDEKEVLFCSLGKSDKITQENGCICGTCPVMERMGLTRLYYCTRGNETQQREI